jgi:hypothetical protein
LVFDLFGLKDTLSCLRWTQALDRNHSRLGRNSAILIELVIGIRVISDRTKFRWGYLPNSKFCYNFYYYSIHN